MLKKILETNSDCVFGERYKNNSFVGHIKEIIFRPSYLAKSSLILFINFLNYDWYKNDEWEKFLGATTQWDLDTYLDCLP